MAHTFNGELFAKDIRAKRGKLTLRDLSEKLDIGLATLSRAENAKKLESENFLILCHWLDENPAKYLQLDPNKNDNASIQLRAAQNMSAEMANAFQELIKAAYAEIYAQTDAHDKA